MAMITVPIRAPSIRQCHRGAELLGTAGDGLTGAVSRLVERHGREQQSAGIGLTAGGELLIAIQPMIHPTAGSSDADPDGPVSTDGVERH